jgi:parallel beta-helix repeat protein
MENVIGPDNIIAYNDRFGIAVEGSDSSGNTLTQNSIHDNGGAGIRLLSGGNSSLDAPLTFDFDLAGGMMTGTTCANCTVEIFSDSSDEGANYEGQAVADSNGVFTFNKGAAFINTNITSTASDADGNTSEFSNQAGRTTRVIVMQEGNSLPGFWLLTRPSSQLVADTRLGSSLYSSNIWNDIPHLDSILHDLIDFGIKRLDTSMQEIEEPIDWNRSEFEIFMEYDRFIDELNENGVAVNYMLHFWDKAGHASGKELSTPRFKTAEQVQDFLDYVRFVVGHFKGRVQYYTIWSEPDNCGPPQIKCVELNDYINLARQTIPIIRQEDPQAKVALAPNVLFFARDYLFTILRSDVIPMFDVIQWHGIYDVAPNIEFYGNYYYEYPSIIQEIKQTASAHGFQGEYWGTELTWCSEEFPSCHPPDHPWGIQKTDKLAAKYYARGIVMQLGMDVGVGFGGLESTAAPWTYPTIRNLNTIMAGSTPTSLIVEIESEATNIMSYGFMSPNGDKLFALWTNGTAVDNDPGVNTTLTFPGLSARKVVGLDVLNGSEQELVTETENGNLVIRNLLVKDYPIILRLID